MTGSSSLSLHLYPHVFSLVLLVLLFSSSYLSPLSTRTQGRFAGRVAYAAGMPAATRYSAPPAGSGFTNSVPLSQSLLFVLFPHVTPGVACLVPLHTLTSLPPLIPLHILPLRLRLDRLLLLSPLTLPLLYLLPLSLPQPPLSYLLPLLRLSLFLPLSLHSLSFPLTLPLLVVILNHLWLTSLPRPLKLTRALPHLSLYLQLLLNLLLILPLHSTSHSLLFPPLSPL